jgi:hypothetical protein
MGHAASGRTTRGGRRFSRSRRCRRVARGRPATPQRREGRARRRPGGQRPGGFAEPGQAPRRPPPALRAAIGGLPSSGERIRAAARSGGRGWRLDLSSWPAGASRQRPLAPICKARANGHSVGRSRRTAAPWGHDLMVPPHALRRPPAARRHDFRRGRQWCERVGRSQRAAHGIFDFARMRARLPGARHGGGGPPWGWGHRGTRLGAANGCWMLQGRLAARGGHAGTHPQVFSPRARAPHAGGGTPYPPSCSTAPGKASSARQRHQQPSALGPRGLCTGNWAGQLHAHPRRAGPRGGKVFSLKVLNPTRPQKAYFFLTPPSPQIQPPQALEPEK